MTYSGVYLGALKRGQLGTPPPGLPAKCVCLLCVFVLLAGALCSIGLKGSLEERRILESPNLDTFPNATRDTRVNCQLVSGPAERKVPGAGCVAAEGLAWAGADAPSQRGQEDDLLYPVSQ